MTKTIRQSVTLKARPREVYRALMDSKAHEKFTGAAAKISGRVGGSFTAWDGYIEGVNVELVPGKKIVQEWRADDWPEGSRSVVTITLKPVQTGTRLTFVQRGVPATEYASIKSGWSKFYWDPLKEYFGGRPLSRRP
jgi:uncharacterized protein YndB with AHSA1/START domain